MKTTGSEISKMTCEDCHEAMLLTTVPMEVLYGHGTNQVTIIADVPAWQCTSCGDIVTAEGAEQAEHEAVCKFLGRYNPNEIRSIRDKLGLTQAALALRLRVSRVTLARWESAVQIQSSGHNDLLASIYSEHIRRIERTKQFTFRTDVSHRQAASLAFELRAVA